MNFYRNVNTIASINFAIFRIFKIISIVGRNVKNKANLMI